MSLLTLAHAGCGRLILGCRVPGTAANRESVPRLRGAATSGHTAQSDRKKRQAPKQEDVLNSFLELSRGPEKRLPRQSPLLTSTFTSDSPVELGCQPGPSCPISGLISAWGSVSMQSVGVLRSSFLDYFQESHKESGLGPQTMSSGRWKLFWLISKPCLPLSALSMLRSLWAAWR